LESAIISPRGGKILHDNKIENFSNQSDKKNKSISRKNEYTNKDEEFNPNQYIVSPSIQYISHPMKGTIYPALLEEKKKTLVKTCFEVAVLSDIYSIGQQTLGNSNDKRYDEIISNNQLEWYWEDQVIGGTYITSLLIKIEDAF